MEYIENKELEEKEIKGIFTDMIKYFPSKLCGMFGNMITVPIYTSLFSQEQYGLYTISIAMLSYFNLKFLRFKSKKGFFNAPYTISVKKTLSDIFIIAQTQK